mmetsp:Transcript_114638/g.331295  ORF Transcript_114638/g.331295 Transcript_114638/m.331295 type:complete len:694 (+) Transcript_114638:16-2097(+)
MAMAFVSRISEGRAASPRPPKQSAALLTPEAPHVHGRPQFHGMTPRLNGKCPSARGSSSSPRPSGSASPAESVDAAAVRIAAEQAASEQMRLWMQGMEERLMAQLEILDGRVELRLGSCSEQWDECRKQISRLSDAQAEIAATLNAKVGDAALGGAKAKPAFMTQGSGLSSIPSEDRARLRLQQQQQMTPASTATEPPLPADYWQANPAPPDDGESIGKSTTTASMLELEDADDIPAGTPMLAIWSERAAQWIRSAFGEPKVDSILYWLADSTYFNTFSLLSTIGNCVLLAVDIDAATSDALQKAMRGEVVQTEDRPVLFILQQVFLGLLAFEVIVRFLAQKADFFIGSNRCWNMFDLLILAISMLELVIAGSNRSFVRVLRVIRSDRALQAARCIRFFDGLQRMLVAMSSVAATLFWAACLMFISFFIVGLSMMEGVRGFAASEDIFDHIGGSSAYSVATAFGGPDSTDLLQDMDNYYGSVGRTLCTLFRAISGADWTAFAAPLYVAGWYWGLLWLLYIFFAAFGILNVVTGIIVDIMRRPFLVDRASQIAAEIEEETTLRKMFELELNVGRRRRHNRDTEEMPISKKTFDALIKRPAIVKMLRTSGLDVDRLDDAFNLIDKEGLGFVKISVAAHRVLALRGEARSQDLTRMSRDFYNLRGELSTLGNLMVQIHNTVQETALAPTLSRCAHI